MFNLPKYLAFLHENRRYEEVGSKRREDADDSHQAEVQTHGAGRRAEAGEHCRSDNRRDNDGNTHYTERATDGRLIVACAVVLQLRVVDEVDGIIHRHTQHHRQ